MKRWLCVFLALCAVCVSSGCQSAKPAEAEFSLDEETVTAALIETGLLETASEYEVRAETENSLSYTIPGPGEEDWTIVLVSGGVSEGKRILQVVSRAPAISEKPAFSWADWERQLSFAALLYGFSDQKALYDDFSTQALPEETYSAEEKQARMVSESYTWESEIPEGYCIARYQLDNAQTVHTFPSAQVLSYAPRLHLSVYPSKAEYEAMRKQAAERQQAAREKLAAEASA